MHLIVEPVWPWVGVLGASAALIALVFFTYPSAVRNLRPAHRRFLLGLRLASVLSLILMMIRPGIEFRNTDRSRAALYIASDVSQSMTTPDGPAGITRRKAVLDRIDTNRLAPAAALPGRRYRDDGGGRRSSGTLSATFAYAPNRERSYSRGEGDRRPSRRL